MDTKEAIEGLKRDLDNRNVLANKDIIKHNNRAYRELIKLLKRGEKFEAMWGKLTYEIEHILAPYFSYEDKLRAKNDVLYIRKITRDIKQKYFPEDEVVE